MAGKRRDKQGRILLAHEYQRANGRYEYRYTDPEGKERIIYSWTLTQTDRIPKGREEGPCLRVLEDQINRDRKDGIKTHEAQSLTLNDLFEINLRDRQVKDSTRVNYRYMYERHVKNGLGKWKIGDIRYSDIKRFYTSLIEECGFKPNSMEIMNTILHPIFTTAVRDGYIRSNPTEGVMREIKKRHDWEKPHRFALTQKQQSVFVDYVSSSATYGHWMPLFTVLLGTGGRVGEIIGLTWDNVDFKKNVITIDHNLIYRQHDNGKCHYDITTPKTKAGVRQIPMFPAVRKALLEERKRQMEHGFNKSVIDGYSGFIFCNRDGNVVNAHSINRVLTRIINSYNVEEEQRAEAEHREPFILPMFCVHQLRHTFCTRLCENTSDTNTLKNIQEIMGHADISTTLDVYTDLTLEQKQDAFAELTDKIKIC